LIDYYYFEPTTSAVCTTRRNFLEIGRNEQTKIERRKRFWKHRAIHPDDGGAEEMIHPPADSLSSLVGVDTVYVKR
jgi:hypothetical protein